MSDASPSSRTWKESRDPADQPEVFACGLSGHYRLVRQLKRGAGVETALGVEVVTGEHVVIKTMNARIVPQEAWRRLERDARILRELDSPWFAPVLDVGFDAERLYVVTPFVAGVTLRERLADGALSVSDALTMARCVLNALDQVHAHGILHTNVKPANIIVDGTARLEQAILTDFGGPWSSALGMSLHHQPGRIAEYMAPELAGALDQEVDERADLYSLGVVLYECLVGYSRFARHSMEELLREQLATPAPSIRSLGVPIPAALEEIVQRLLRVHPRQRYQSAGAALADLEAVMEELRQGVREPSTVVGASDQRQTLAEPTFLGREDELALLEQHFSNATDGSGSLVVVEASSGGGKTRLLDEFSQRAAASGAWVCRGQSIQWAAPRPLQILRGVVADLAAAARSDPAIAEGLVERVGDARVPLCEVFPELRETLGVPEESTATGPEAAGQARSIMALVSLLDALGCPERPAVVVLDDAHWADELTNRVLCEWTRLALSGDEKQRHVVVVAAVRPVELHNQPPAWALGDAFHLTLQPLGPAEITQMVQSMAGAVPAEAVDLVVKLSDGNPFMASAVLHGLVEAGALTSDGLSWHLESESAAWQASREAAAFLARRMNLLDRPTRHLLDAAAVLGREFNLSVARSLTGLSDTETHDAITQATNRHIVWQTAAERYMFVHDRLREVLLNSLDRAELTRLHLHAAIEIERTDASQVFDIAYHFDAAGEPGRAVPYALEAGKIARAQHGLELAELQYRIAERGMEETDQATQQQVTEALGQTLMLRGRYDEAEQRLELSRSLARDNVSAARLKGELGELAFKRDAVEAAADRIEAALRLLGERVPRGALSLGLHLLRELVLRIVIILRLHRATARRDEQRWLTARLLARLQYAWSFKRRRSAGVWVMLRHLNVAQRDCSGSSELAHSYAIHGAGVALTFPFLWQYGLRYADRGLSLHRQHGNLWGEGQARSMRGCVLYAARRYSDAVEAFGHATRLLEQSGDLWELNFAAWNRAMCLARLARPQEAAEQARSTHQAAVEIGDVLAEAAALEVWAKATRGHLNPELMEATLRHPGGDFHSHAAALQANALRLRATGRLDESLSHFQTAAELVKQSGARNAYFVGVFPWLATVSREVAEERAERERSGEPHTSRVSKNRRPHFRQAHRAVRQSMRYAIIYRNDRPHALRETAILAALSGRHRRAQKLFDRSDRIATRHQAWAEVTENARQRSRLSIPSNRPGNHDRRPAQLSGVDAAETAAHSTPVALVERFATLLDAGARLASATSTQGIADAIRETTLTLLRAEKCEIVGTEKCDVVGTDDIDIEAFDQESYGTPEWRRVLVQRAVEKRQPVALTGLLIDNPDAVDSLILTGVKSALCAPILGRGEVVGYFLAYHFGVADLFGEDEERLAEFIAHLAGAAFEREVIRQEARATVFAAQENERARVARDLHDEVGQALTSMLLDIRSLESSAQDGLDVDHLLRSISQLRKVTNQTLADVQRLAFDLRPTILDDLGLVDALQRLGHEITSHHDVTVQMEAGQLGRRRLPSNVETTAYRVVQEALTNVVRHSGASTCSVMAAPSHDRLRIVVEDDGLGFDPQAKTTDNLGLQGMTERAQLAGGTLKVVSEPHAGTMVILEVPLD